MIPLIEALRKEIKSAKPRRIVDLNGAVQKGEKVIGVLPEHLRSFYEVTIMHHFELRKNRLSASSYFEKLANIDLAKKDSPEVIALANCIIDHEEAELIEKLFWHEVRRAFPVEAGLMTELSDRFSMAIRKNWQVVICTKTLKA